MWRPTTISYILTNSFYTGDSVWQKTFATDALPIQQVKNHGQKPKYHVDDDHPAIVSREDFQRVQELIALRKEQFYDNARQVNSVYSRKIFCGHCGCAYRRKICRAKVYWDCNRHNKGKDQCPSHQIPEGLLTAAALRLHNKLALHGQEILQPLLDQLKELRERELRSSRRLSDIDSEIANISEQNLVLTRLKTKGCIDPALALSQSDELDRKLRDLRRLRRGILENADGDEQIRATEDMIRYLENATWQTEVVPELFAELVERITVVSKDQVKFRLLNGLELTEELR